jgi:CelD/BcsL family acetyltransferase involved in cellulose biosynthesis
MNVHVRHQGAPEAQVVPRVERVDSFDDLRPEWTALAERCGGIFATWEWNASWWTHHGEGRELLLHACRSPDGELVTVLPLYLWRARWLRVLRFLGHGEGDELGPVQARGDEALGARGLRSALDSLRWDVFLGEQLSGRERWSVLLDGSTWRWEADPVAAMPPGGWDGYLAERSQNFRQQLKRRQRELDEAGEVRFRLADRDSLDRDLNTLFALHRARWGTRRTAFGDTPFHRELARSTLARGWLRLWLLELDGRPVAAWHGFQVGGVTSYYQAGRDPAYEGFSVGFVLLAHTVRAAIEEGATEYRFGRGAEAFKYRFATDDPGLETVALASGAKGRIALALGRSARSLRRLRSAAGWPRHETSG